MIDVIIDTIDASKTQEEQQAKIEKILLVALLSKKQKKRCLPYAGALKETV